MRLFLLRHSALLLLLLADAYPAEPLDDAALGKLVAAGRAELEAALPARRAGTPIDARPGTPVDAALGAIGVPPRLRTKAAALFDALPRFDDTSGAALNAAAAQLVEGSGRNLPRGAAPPLPTLRAAEFADGLWKYVLLEVTDAGGASRRLARNYADSAYHAEMAKEATRRELGGYPNVTVRGGGRLLGRAAHDRDLRLLQDLRPVSSLQQGGRCARRGVVPGLRGDVVERGVLGVFYVET